MNETGFITDRISTPSAQAVAHISLSHRFFGTVLISLSDANLTNDFWLRRPSVVEMSVFSQECDQREQCAQPVDTNGPPYHLSCAALDQRDHSQQGSITLDSPGASDRCPVLLAACSPTCLGVRRINPRSGYQVL